VTRALVTHGHADHARGGHGDVWATPETLAIMGVRYGDAHRGRAMAYRETITIGDIAVTFHPAGHVLGSAQILLEKDGERVVASGDYKRRPDPTCEAFEPVTCDVFITEATFGLPVFRHPDTRHEIAKLTDAIAAEPDRCVLVGAYALGKAQRVITELRAAGHDAPLYIHGALQRLCDLYRDFGVDLGELPPDGVLRLLQLGDVDDGAQQADRRPRRALVPERTQPPRYHPEGRAVRVDLPVEAPEQVARCDGVGGRPDPRVDLRPVLRVDPRQRLGQGRRRGRSQ